MPQPRRAQAESHEADDERRPVVQRNFMVYEDQAERLRDMAYFHRTSQAKLLREAIDDLLLKYSGKPATPPQHTGP